MHKSWGNSIEFNEAADSIGADVMRWMFCAQRYEADLLFGYHTADETRRKFLLPLWNVYSFFVTYARIDGWKPGTAARDLQYTEMDRWIRSRLQQLVAEVSSALDSYLAYKGTKAVEDFLDDLSNWYVRRSRRRFWKSETDTDKQAAYATLYEVLVTLTKLLAPFVPFVTELLYQNLVVAVQDGAPKSVHHSEWPAVDSGIVDEGLVADMAVVRSVVALGHAVRAAANLKVRQPLARAAAAVPPGVRDRLLRHAPVIMDELNVKALDLVDDESELVSYKLLPENRQLGAKFGPLFPKVRAALSAIDPQQAALELRAGKAIRLTVEGQEVELSAAEVLVRPQPRPGFATKSEADCVVALETTVTDELREEGWVREIVRHVQDQRKTAGFAVTDRIRTRFEATPKLAKAIAGYADYIKKETLSVELSDGLAPAGDAAHEDEFDGEKIRLTVAKA